MSSWPPHWMWTSLIKSPTTLNSLVSWYCWRKCFGHTNILMRSTLLYTIETQCDIEGINKVSRWSLMSWFSLCEKVVHLPDPHFYMIKWIRWYLFICVFVYLASAQPSQWGSTPLCKSQWEARWPCSWLVGCGHVTWLSQLNSSAWDIDLEGMKPYIRPLD